MSKGKLSMFKNTSYLQSSVTILLFFTSWGVWWSFFQLWLTSTKNGLGLSGSAVGTIYSANSVVTLILMFVYGALQDKLQLKRTLLVGCAILETLIGPFFTWIYAPLLKHSFVIGIIIGAIFLSAGFLAASPVFEAFIEKISRKFDFEYGQARGMGIIWLCTLSAISRLFVCNQSQTQFLVWVPIWIIFIIKFTVLETKAIFQETYSKCCE